MFPMTVKTPIKPPETPTNEANVKTGVKLVEVGPRDGLQNEKALSIKQRLALITGLSRSGLRCIEAGSLVSSARVPQMAQTDELYPRLLQDKALRSCSLPVLVASQRGLERALALNVKEIAVFGSASEAFCQHNIGCSVSQSLERFAAITEQAISAGLQVRAYLSCTQGCPWQGDVSYAATAALANDFYQLGCYEISLGDTTGIGTPYQALKLFEQISKTVPMPVLAAHLHDTRGQALASLFALLEHGLEVIDCAVAGLGGCPYAPGASGNVATEDVVYLLEGSGIKTGVDLQRLISTGWSVCRALGHAPRSKTAFALRSQPQQADHPD